MIRHNVVQNPMSAEAAPLYFEAGMPANAHTVPLPNLVEIRGSDNDAYETSARHPFTLSLPSHYAGQRTSCVQLRVTNTAEVASLKLSRSLAHRLKCVVAVGS